MKYSFLKQLWVALKIWAIALSANTIAGALYLEGTLELPGVILGLVVGAVFSLPVAAILLIVIHHCVSRRKDGLEIFRYVFVFGLLLTFFSAIFFLVLVPEAPVALLMIAVLAATTAIGLQYNALFKLANYDNEFEKFLS